LVLFFLLILEMTLTASTDPGIIPSKVYQGSIADQIDAKYMTINSKEDRRFYLQMNKDQVY